ncbi:amino acid ABC transporter permease [Arenibaculum sp.]|jgi:polar amino acid transport system permease protein|uniref:amino acid ABC transporter permease n=1 Tax=Arenibaculum sp. TaxID=2865862 RepID=UPI002E12B266|nr:amino acid ABC transporter permease [Arenibaculum sp.]
MDFGLMARLFPFFVEAAWTTVQISFLALALGLVLAAFGAAAKLSAARLPRVVGSVYVSLFRGTPALIQLFVLYFGGPQVGINLEPFAAGVIGLGLNIGAYMTESIRGAILAIERGQVEAARTLGLGRTQALRKVVLPQAARLMIRPLGVNAVALVKGSALVSTISVVELTYTAQRFIGSTYRPFEIFAVAALLYMVIVYAVARCVDYLDARYAIE